MKSIFIDFQNIKPSLFNGKIIVQFTYEVLDTDTELRDVITKQLVVAEDQDLPFTEIHQMALDVVHEYERQFMENQ